MIRFGWMESLFYIFFDSKNELDQKKSCHEIKDCINQIFKKTNYNGFELVNCDKIINRSKNECIFEFKKI